MSITVLCPREVSRAKDGRSLRVALPRALRRTLGGWFVVLAVCLNQTVLAWSVEECVERCEASVALIQGSLGSGTGFIVAPGIVATNRHVIDDELIETLRISFPTPHEHTEGPFSCTLRYISDEHDIAFLQIEAPHPALELAATAKLRRGQPVLTIGNPALGDEFLLNAIAAGIVSSEFLIGGHKYRRISINVHAGNSGGPILDQAGCVVGIVSCVATDKAGIAFCIPADTVRQELARAQALSAKQAQKMAADYSLRVLCTRYLIATESLLRVCQMQTLSRTLQDADLMADGPAALEQAASLAEGCREALNTLLADERVPVEAKQPLQELATLHDAARDAAAGPRGPVTLYVLYCRKLLEEFDRVAAKVRKQL